ncbi:MAG TPA: hypothetical protein DE060_16025 [Lentisphaeria bacterium]|nr:hypothetical protein [Lentisphaeria bacterium]
MSLNYCQLLFSIFFHPNDNIPEKTKLKAKKALFTENRNRPSAPFPENRWSALDGRQSAPLIPAGATAS